MTRVAEGAGAEPDGERDVGRDADGSPARITDDRMSVADRFSIPCEQLVIARKQSGARGRGMGQEGTTPAGRMPGVEAAIAPA
jgi:hypothetical protein